MNRKAIKYWDTYAAPGSELYAALVDGDMHKAAEIYERCERERIALERNGVTT